MSKKIISLFMIISMLLSCVAVSVSADSAENQAYTNSTEFLKGLGIIDGSADINTNVTRAKAAEFICAMLDEDKNHTRFRGIFSDVSEDSEGALCIERLADLGIIRGGENFTYRPSDMLTYQDAQAMFAYVLGYGLVENMGKTPYKVASEFGIMDSVTAEFDFVTVGDFYVMMRNALKSGMYIESSFGAEKSVYKTDQMLMNKVYDIVYADGIITKNDLTSLWAAESASASEIWLKLSDDSEIKITVPDYEVIRDEIGKNVRVYYKDSDDMSKYQFVYYELRNNKILNFGLERVGGSKIDPAEGKMSYYDSSDSLKTAKLASDASIIYNGVVYKSNNFDLAEAQGKVGTVELIDADSDSKYETIKINMYRSIVAGNVSIENHFITDKFEAKNTLDINETSYDKIFVYDENGAPASLEDITIGDVVSAAVSDVFKGQNILTIRFSTKSVSGRITENELSEKTPYVVIDEENKYYVFDRALSGKYNQSSDVVAYLDVFGNIIYITNDFTRDMQYGIMVGIRKYDSEKDGLDEVSLKIISTAGNIIDYILDKKPYIDGNSYKDRIDEAYAALINVSVKTNKIDQFPQGVYPIRYKLSSDGKTVKKIDTVAVGADNNDDTLKLLCAGTYYVNTGRVLGWKVPYAEDAVVLELSATDYSDIETFRDEENINVSSTSSACRVGSGIHVMALKSDNNSSEADFIIKFNNVGTNIDNENNLFVVDTVSDRYNEKHETTMKYVTGYLMGSKTQFWVEYEHPQIELINSLERGDIIRYNLSQDNRLLTCENILRQGPKGFTTYSVMDSGFREDWGTGVTILCGYAYSMDKTFVRTNMFETGLISDTAATLDWDNLLKTDALKYVNVMSSIAVTVVDMGNDLVTTGSASDISDYVNFGTDCSMIVAKYRRGNLSEVVVYNK